MFQKSNSYFTPPSLGRFINPASAESSACVTIVYVYIFVVWALNEGFRAPYDLHNEHIWPPE